MRLVGYMEDQKRYARKNIRMGDIVVPIWHRFVRPRLKTDHQVRHYHIAMNDAKKGELVTVHLINPNETYQGPAQPLTKES